MTARMSLPIYITTQDKVRLLEMIRKIELSKGRRDDLRSLVGELERATIVEPQDIPNDVVTMNSLVSVINMATEEDLMFILAYPEDADAERNKISVLAPIGSAVLGFRVGDEVEWKLPSGMQRFKISKVDYQPEARKHFHR